uniref:DUF6598 domain-containing protein n=1 Tax=Triticum aestivum TaxID=4565 RepID=A0A077RQI2_WHEAT|nr:unnamed protein product [Triticum aestivum]
MKALAIDPELEKLIAEARKESAMAGERERIKMLADAAQGRSNAMDPEEVRRKTVEAEEMKQLKTLKRKDAQVAAKKLEASEMFDEKRAKSVVGAKAVKAKEDTHIDDSYDEASMYRHGWEELWAALIPSMRYMDKPPASELSVCSYMHTLNVFSVKLAGIDDSLRWPLYVFGVVAARNYLDHNHNIIFLRDRDNCQIIHQKDPYLELTGPTRGVVVVDPTEFEVKLKVKGSTESEDRDLSFLITRYNCYDSENRSRVINRVMTSLLSTLELTFGHIVRSVEATISVRFIGGTWPDGFRGVFTASTASIHHMKVTLLAYRDGKLRVDSCGMIALSRDVACVELDGKLKVSVVARGEDKEAVEESADMVFTPKKAGRSCGIMKIGSCAMEVTVAWTTMDSVWNDCYGDNHLDKFNEFIVLSDLDDKEAKMMMMMSIHEEFAKAEAGAEPGRQLAPGRLRAMS